jgi:uncharacterized phage protein (TIGR01671 family)
MMKKKFRLWDKENQKMIYPNTIYGDEMGENTELISQYIAGEMSEFVDGEFQESYVLQQFTGIFDRKMNEVYEGDIIKVSTTVDAGEFFDLDVNGTFEVYYNQNISGFDLKMIETTHKEFSGYSLLQEWSEEFERISNIFDFEEIEKY